MAFPSHVAREISIPKGALIKPFCISLPVATRGINSESNLYLYNQGAIGLVLRVSGIGFSMIVVAPCKEPLKFCNPEK